MLNDSIKERFDLKYDEVAPFMEGSLTAREVVEEFAKKKAGKVTETSLREMLGLVLPITVIILLIFNSRISFSDQSLWYCLSPST